MFGLGFWEIAVVLLLAVMLFPPKELPTLARSLARTYGSLKRTAEDFRNTVMHDDDLREPLDEIRGAYNDARWQVRDMEKQARREIARARTEARLAADVEGRTSAPAPGRPAIAVGGLDDDDDDEDVDADEFYSQAHRDPMEGEGDADDDAPHFVPASEALVDRDERNDPPRDGDREEGAA